MEIPRNKFEAFDALDEILSDEDKQWLIENGALSVHHTLGRWIRNEWGLWKGSDLKDYVMRQGYDHPDDMSNYIIEEYIKYLNVHQE